MVLMERILVKTAERAHLDRKLNALVHFFKSQRRSEGN